MGFPSYRIIKLKFMFRIVQYFRLHNLEYKFIFKIVEFRMDNFKKIENMRRLQEDIMGV